MPIGLLADIQYADQEDTFTEGRCQRYREAPGKLQQAVKAFVAQEPQLSCVLTLGDIINGRHATQQEDIQDLDLVLELLQPLAAAGVPMHHTFGNHCLSLPRDMMLRRLAAIPSQDSKLGEEAAAYQEAHPLSEQEPHMHGWNGGIGSDQMRWLRQQLQRADADGVNVICSCHHQLGPGAARATHMAWNHKSILEVILGGACVKLVLSGHDHMGGYACIQGKHFVTLEALLEAPSGANAFATLDLLPKAIIVTGHGSCRSRQLAI
ncbi:hypothetical protein WJX74_003943 [Apatococcus lobatus]|uniref:Calcineurin-like phosphoesterase domain-containing protein n=1 Tax=Apatococcus lobatus TaxID=904363 RepID=A0AAW1RZJ6_9CHLO